MIEPLVDPTAHGGDPNDAFHVVCPSLPGFGFSSKPKTTGWGVERIAATWARLMDQLGSICSSRLQVSCGAWLSDGSSAVLAAALEALIIGAIVFALRWLYFRIRGHHGLGLGDVKLLAASAVWIGVAGVPMQLLVGSVTALIAAVALHVTGRTMTRQTALPFGPFLALGLLVTLALQQLGWVV